MQRKLWTKNSKKKQKVFVRWKSGENEPLRMSVFCTDAEDKQWSIHRYTHHMEIDSIARYRMLLIMACGNQYIKVFQYEFRSGRMEQMTISTVFRTINSFSAAQIDLSCHSCNQTWQADFDSKNWVWSRLFSLREQAYTRIQISRKIRFIAYLPVDFHFWHTKNDKIYLIW